MLLLSNNWLVECVPFPQSPLADPDNTLADDATTIMISDCDEVIPRDMMESGN
jgi:hypothetical protein